MKWLAVKPIVGRPSTSSPKPVLVGQREPPRVAVVAVLLREDVRHVLVRRPCSRKRPTTVDGAPVGVALPRPAARTTRAARGPARARARRRPRQVAELAARADLVLDEQRARGEQAVALPVERRRPSAPRPEPRCDDLDRRRVARTDSSCCSIRSRPSSSQRASTPLRPLAAAAAARRCRSRARQSWSARPGDEDVPPVAARAREHAGRRGRRPRARGRLEHDRPASRSAAPPGAPGAPAPRQRELLPRDLVARRRPLGRAAEEEAERDESLAGGVRRGRARRRAPRPARRAARGSARAATTSPSTVSSHSPRRSSRLDEVAAVADPEAAAARAPRRATGRARNLSSCSAGCGVRSGQTMPVGAEVRVVRRRRRSRRRRPSSSRPRASRCRIAVVDPLPDEAALQRVVALERGEVVGEAAVRVAHRVRVLAEDQRPRVVVRARPTPRSPRPTAYIGQTMSVARAPARPVEPRSRPRSAAGATGRGRAPSRRRRRGSAP